MRGFPLVNGALIVLALCLALLPLWKLTRASPLRATEQRFEEDARATVSTRISVRYAHPPSVLTVSHLGESVWSPSSSAEIDAGKALQLALPEEGIDLLVTATWPEGTPMTALEVMLEPEARFEQSRVLWGEGQCDDILTFTWDD